MSATTAGAGGSSGFSAMHPDIIKYHVLTRLDGPALASIACCSSDLRRVSSSDDLWSRICSSTWPSTASPRLRLLVSTFPGGGARAFFSQAYPMLPDVRCSLTCPSPPKKLISAVDMYYKGELIFSKVQEMETSTDWFRCSPFSIDLLGPKDAVPTSIRLPATEDEVAEVTCGMTLSWILIDPEGLRAVNLSSHLPVEAQRHWLTRDVQVRYASVVGGVQCRTVVTCGESEGLGMQVQEVSIEMEDMDGRRMNGKDSLVFLQAALEGERGTGKNRAEEARRRYRDYVEVRRERSERRLRREGALDLLCVTFGVSIFFCCCCFLLFRNRGDNR